MNDFLKGFIKGVKETPRGFFAPAVAIWRLLISVSDSLTAGTEKDEQGYRKTRL